MLPLSADKLLCGGKASLTPTIMIIMSSTRFMAHVRKAVLYSI